MTQGIILSEVSQTEKDKYCMISPICGVSKNTTSSEYNEKKQTNRNREQTSGYQWGEGRKRGNIQEEN